MSQYSIDFQSFDSEFDLAQALAARTGRDLFAGTTTHEDRKAAARIAIVMNKLEDLRPRFERVYGEAISDVKTTKGKRS